VWNLMLPQNFTQLRRDTMRVIHQKLGTISLLLELLHTLATKEHDAQQMTAEQYDRWLTKELPIILGVPGHPFNIKEVQRLTVELDQHFILPAEESAEERAHGVH